MYEHKLQPFCHTTSNTTPTFLKYSNVSGHQKHGRESVAVVTIDIKSCARLWAEPGNNRWVTMVTESAAIGHKFKVHVHYVSATLTMDFLIESASPSQAECSKMCGFLAAVPSWVMESGWRRKKVTKVKRWWTIPVMSCVCIYCKTARLYSKNRQCRK